MIYRWVQEYGKLLYQIWKKKNKKSFYLMSVNFFNGNLSYTKFSKEKAILNKPKL